MSSRASEPLKFVLLLEDYVAKLCYSKKIEQAVMPNRLEEQAKPYAFIRLIRYLRTLPKRVLAEDDQARHAAEMRKFLAILETDVSFLKGLLENEKREREQRTGSLNERYLYNIQGGGSTLDLDRPVKSLSGKRGRRRRAGAHRGHQGAK